MSKNEAKLKDQGTICEKHWKQPVNFSMPQSASVRQWNSHLCIPPSMTAIFPSHIEKSWTNMGNDTQKKRQAQQTTSVPCHKNLQRRTGIKSGPKRIPKSDDDCCLLMVLFTVNAAVTALVTPASIASTATHSGLAELVCISARQSSWAGAALTSIACLRFRGWALC